MTTTLLAVTGLSPAIVTETVWALAHRDPAIIPDRVTFVTTFTGAEMLERRLFEASDDWGGLSVWESLRRAVGAGPDQLIASPCQIITLADGTAGRELPLDDIRTPAENHAAAEFIFSKVWEVVRDKDQRLIASVAGGRKTMGALLHAAVSLIGREDDLITHVLVNAPYDNLPGFFFPAQPACPLVDARTGRAHEAADAEITLAEVPFVPLRNRFKDLDELPASFITLGREWSQRLKLDAERPALIRIDHDCGMIEVDGVPHRVRPRALSVIHFILWCQENHMIPGDQATAVEAYHKCVAKKPSHFGPIYFDDLAEEDFRRELNHLRDILKHASWKPAKRTLRQDPFVLETAPS
jgi:CRISPR-associated protein (TIGR02584 family)